MRGAASHGKRAHPGRRPPRHVPTGHLRVNSKEELPESPEVTSARGMRHILLDSPSQSPRARPSNSQSASSGSRERWDRAVPQGVERHPAPFTDRALHPGKQAQVRRTEGALRPPRLQPLVSPGAKQSAAAWGARLCGVFTSQGSEPGHQEGERHAQVTKQSVTGLGLAPEVQLSGHPHRAGRARSLTVQGCAGAHGQQGSGWRHRLDQGASSGDEDVLVNRPFLTALDLL